MTTSGQKWIPIQSILEIDQVLGSQRFIILYENDKDYEKYILKINFALELMRILF
jgi:hypothetical protein